MGLVKHSAALCIFLKVLLWKLVVVVNKVTIILEENFQRGRRDPSMRLSSEARWSQKWARHPNWELIVTGPKHPLWWDPDFWAHEELSVTSPPHRGISGFSSNKLPTTGFLHWFFLFCNHDSIITCFLLGQLTFHFCASSHLWKMWLHISAFSQQISKSSHSSWRVLNPITTSTRVARLPDLEDYIRSSVILRWVSIWQPAANILKCSYPLIIISS